MCYVLSLSLYVRNVLNINVHAGEEEEEHAEERRGDTPVNRSSANLRSGKSFMKRQRYGDRIMDIVSKINK